MTTQQIHSIKARETWLKVYQDLGSVAKAARRCGIARSTLYRWIERFKELGKEGLKDKSKRPHKLFRLKVTEEQEQLILSIRKKYKYGQKRISAHLLRHHGLKLSSTTVWRILHKHQVAPVKKTRRSTKRKRYNRPVPGDRVQIDVTKIGPKCYQFTAIDDCTRLRVLRLYPDKTADRSLTFLKEIIKAFPFPIQRIQTDWGTEFFNYLFQEALADHCIKFRPIKPRSPHLNGKVERSQQTDKVEFYSVLNLKDKSLNLTGELTQWEEFYNKQRMHSSLQGKTPWEKYLEVQQQVPTHEQIRQLYAQKKEDILARNYTFIQWKKKQALS
ncbi:IS481 family transposase [Rhodocytophaga rosea]|uniref:IS481 family transposase n=1 Tax=Rhodocytophaga rosea TaxID=2704465 RepID=A0A6C0GBS5_9BACT|nr:IS481 family transposase [Rhodocytophaga rosea]QHT65338.1 IS481 family transposase [Rhodocytophaga rosea]